MLHFINLVFTLYQIYWDPRSHYKVIGELLPMEFVKSSVVVDIGTTTSVMKYDGSLLPILSLTSLSYSLTLWVFNLLDFLSLTVNF